MSGRRVVTPEMRGSPRQSGDDSGPAAMPAQKRVRREDAADRTKPESPDRWSDPESEENTLPVPKAEESMRNLAQACLTFSNAFGYLPHAKLELFTNTWMNADPNRFKSCNASEFFRGLQFLTDALARIGPQIERFDGNWDDAVWYIVRKVPLGCESWLDEFLVLDGVSTKDRETMLGRDDDGHFVWTSIALDAASFFKQNVVDEASESDFARHFSVRAFFVSARDEHALQCWTDFILRGLRRAEAAFISRNESALKSPRTFMKEDLPDDLLTACTALAALLAQARRTIDVLSVKQPCGGDVRSAKYIVIMGMLAKMLLDAYTMWIEDDEVGAQTCRGGAVSQGRG